MIDMKHTLDRAGSDLLGATMTIEGIGAALTALASDADGLRAVTPIQATRLCEMLAAECDRVVHRLGLVNDLIEAAGGQEVADETS